MKLLNTILNIIFPVNCIFCKKDGIEICENCLSSCDEAEMQDADWIFPLYDYRNPIIKKAVWFLKYNGKKRIAHFFANIMYGKIMEELSELSTLENFTDPILIPIPLSKKRQKSRGFNQSLLICESIIEIHKDENNFLIEKNVLIKPKDGEHQANIKERSKRLENIVGSFSVINPYKIKNRNIILIDDVLTTGATLGEAKKMLKNAGARKVIAFTIAH